MRASLTFGRILGIPVGVHASWFVVLALVTWSLAASYFPGEYPRWAAGTYWLVAAVTSVIFFGSLLAHELGHALIARREGVPVRAITLFFFGGVSQITREPPTAGSEFRIAIAGPLTSIALAVAFGLMGVLLASVPPLAAPAVYLARVNLFLGVFNLLPGFPLDGGRVLRALIWARGQSFQTGTRWATTAGHLVAGAFVLWGISEMLGGYIMGGLWMLLLGWFLNSAADASYQQMVVEGVLQGVTGRDVMTGPEMTIPDDIPLDRVVHDYVLRWGDPWLYVGNDGTVEGVITLQRINAVPREQWHTVTSGQAMAPLAAVPQAAPDDGVLNLLRRMEETGVDRLPLVEHAHLVGTVSRERLLRYIRTRREVAEVCV